jgi:hypothetical protein
MQMRQHCYKLLFVQAKKVEAPILKWNTCNFFYMPFQREKKSYKTTFVCYKIGYKIA